MKKTKIVAMYLPQYHETDDNNRWWGKGFTDWTSVKTSEKLYKNHRQPRIPKDENYYDLTDVNTIKWQVGLAKKYGIYGFGIYHYWFSTEKQTLTKPAEIILEQKEIDIPFFFAWDNNSWIRSWSRYKHNTNAWSPKVDNSLKEDRKDNGILAELDYGNEKDWELHFNYLNRFFSDERYIKIDNKPLLVIWNYTNKKKLKKMCEYWKVLAVEKGYSGLFLMNRFNPYVSLAGFDALMTYEPMFSAWQNKNIVNRIINKIKEKFIKDIKLTYFDYDKVWKSIIRNAKKNAKKNILYGAFVSYDDTPRRGIQGKVINGDSPAKFEKYLRELIQISEKQGKEFIFLTAWNEWGEGAYLEPDIDNGFEFLEAVKKVCET